MDVYPQGRGFGPAPFGAPPRFVQHDGGSGLHWIVPLLILIVLVAFFAWTVLQSRRRPALVPAAVGAVGGSDPAVTELRLRYARGEVNRDEFLAAESDLRGIAPPAPPPPPAAA